jgi:hypothetical protein
MGEAPGLEALYQDRRDEGLMVISLMGENEFGGAPDAADLARWADSYGSTHPVLADPGFDITARFLNSSSIALPTGHLLTTGAEVVIRDGWPSGSDINNALP